MPRSRHRTAVDPSFKRPSGTLFWALTDGGKRREEKKGRTTSTTSRILHKQKRLLKVCKQSIALGSNLSQSSLITNRVAAILDRESGRTSRSPLKPNIQVLQFAPVRVTVGGHHPNQKLEKFSNPSIVSIVLFTCSLHFAGRSILLVLLQASCVAVNNRSCMIWP